MALPNRAAEAYVVLGVPEDNNPFTDRNITVTDDYQATGTLKPRQLDFSSYPHWLTNYPNEDIAVVRAPICGTLGWLQFELGGSDWDFTYPSDIVYEYDPDPPLLQPAPDPNGNTGNQTGGIPSAMMPQIFPRWHTDDPYDFEPLNFGFNPTPGITFTYNEQSIFGPSQMGNCSYEISVTNLVSEVMNSATSSNEYYPFLQTTTDLKVTTKFKISPHPDNKYICWNEGTVIKGKVGFRSLDVTANPVPSNSTPGYGYGGIEVTFGMTSADAGTADWEVTWEDGYTAAEITIPRTAGKVTFINDFWVTEVIKPA